MRREDPMVSCFGKSRSLNPDRGSFKVLITDAYQRRCAITGERHYQFGSRPYKAL